MRSIHPAVFLVLLVLFTGLQCSDNPSGIESEVLDHFSLSAPDSVTTGEPFTLTVTAVGSQGSIPFSGFSGIVVLAASAGSCSPDSLYLLNGNGSAEIVLSGTTDVQTITATCGGATGSIQLNAGFMTALTGDATDSANEAIPMIDFIANPDNYSAHPDLGTIPVSHNTIMLSFTPGATVAQANAIIHNIGGKIVGGITGNDAIAPGVLFLQLPTVDHAELSPIVTMLRSYPSIETVVQDALMGFNAIPRPNAGNPSDWTWESDAAGWNWGLEQMRVPQLWNWNEAARKQLDTLAYDPPTVLIADDGFVTSHPDLQLSLYPGNLVSSHGTFMAGIIGAQYDNGMGVDGVCPAVNMMCKTILVTVPPGQSNQYQIKTSVGQAVITGTHRAIRAYSRVVNMSVGYNWADGLVDSDTDTLAQSICARQARLFVNVFHLGTFIYRTPLFIVSGGNDSGRGYGAQHVRYNSPMCYAAMEMGIESIIVVQAAQLGPMGGVEWWPFSNVGAHVSAPGDNVGSTVAGAALYGSSIYGSSPAAAYVSGVATYLFYMNPFLNWWEVRDVILTNAIPAGGNAAPFVDAWASAADIDRLRPGEPALRMLCDLDDGSIDGNQRVLYEDGTDFLDEDVDGDGGPGDGKIDMSDFRRWRDWYLASRDTDPVELNGSADHPKKDVNGDGIAGTPAEEQIYPRGDFNGDGKLDPEAMSYVPGTIDAPATDIDVLRAVFDDPDYEEWELPGLVESGDVEFHIADLISGYGATEARVSIWRSDGQTLERDKVISIDDPAAVLTAPTRTGGYTLMLECSGTNGNGTFEFDGLRFPFEPGDDVWLSTLAFIRINPRDTYLHICSEDNAGNALALELDLYDIHPGQYIVIDQVGSYNAGGGWSGSRLSAVFSTDATLLGSNLLHRVPGAIDAGEDIVTLVTFDCDGEVTDIPEDFECRPHAIVKVPAGAKYLFISTNDSKYEDNFDADGDFGALIIRMVMKDLN